MRSFCSSFCASLERLMRPRCRSIALRVNSFAAWQLKYFRLRFFFLLSPARHSALLFIFVLCFSVNHFVDGIRYALHNQDPKRVQWLTSLLMNTAFPPLKAEG